MPKVSKKEVVEREVTYPQVEALVCAGEEAITADLAKSLLGWEEETEQNKFGNDFMLKLDNGVKVRCTNNVGNRPFTFSLCRQWMSEILQGNWQLNGEPFILGRTAVVISGQHRLVALVLSYLEWLKDKECWPAWKEGEPVLEGILVTGIDESDKVVNTIDTGKPRTLTDVIYRSEYFAKMKSADRVRCSKYAADACKLLKSRVGSDLNAFNPNHWSHADYLELLDTHPRLLKCVRHIHEENGDENKIKSFLSPGYAAAFMYLMGCCETDEEGAKTYHQKQSEKALNWDSWDKAETFFTLIAGAAEELQGYRDAWAAMIEQGMDSQAERWALLVTAWNLYSSGEDVVVDSLQLTYNENDDGSRTLIETPTVGGIDLGNPKEADEEAIPGDDPTPQEIEHRKKTTKSGKSKDAPHPVLKPHKEGTDWSVGDVGWVKSEDGDHYLARVYEAPWDTVDAKQQPIPGKEQVAVQDAAGNVWDIELSALSLEKPAPVTKAPAPVAPAKSKLAGGKPKASSKSTPAGKAIEWKEGDIAWVADDEPWKGKIVELSTTIAKLKVQTGFQGAGNIKAVHRKHLSKKQPSAA